MADNIQFTRTENAIGYTCVVLFILGLPWFFRMVGYGFDIYLWYWVWVWS